MSENKVKTVVLNMDQELYEKYSRYCAWEERDISKQTRMLIKDFCNQKSSEEREVDKILGVSNGG